MRRLFIYMIVAFMVVGAVKAMRHGPGRYAPPASQRHRGPAFPEDRATRDVVAAEARQAAAEARRALAEAGRELRDAYREAREELGRAYREAHDEIRGTYREIMADHCGRTALPPVPTLPPALEEAEGLPVPIVPGTRVTDAEARPPVPAGRTSQARPAPAPAATAQDPACEINAGTEVCVARAEARAQNHQEVPGDICATQDRARADAMGALRFKVAEWLAPDVPASWEPSADRLKALVVETKIDPIVKDYGTLYKAALTADFSPVRRAELVNIYNRDLIRHRLTTVGGSLGFVLICLAAISGYIRADEATRGYYTNRLRMLAAAGVGAAGMVVYRMVA